MTSKNKLPDPQVLLPLGRGQITRKRVQIDFTDAPTRTRQAPKAGTQIDAILKRYATQGVSPNDVGVFFQQVASMPFGVQPGTDYQEALNGVIRVENYFMSLPSRIREKFGHKAQNMINFIADPANLEEARELGLVSKEPVKPAPVPAPEPEKKPETPK